MDRVNNITGNTITPFWNRIPHYFLYGLHPRPLFLSIGLGFIALFFPSWWMYIILYAITIRYSVAALQQTARGQLEPPLISWDSVFKGYEIPLMLYFIMFLFFMILGSLYETMGPIIGWVFYGLGIFLFPAMIICIGISESLAFAINPINLISLVRAIGWPYLALYGLIFSLGGAQASVESLFVPDGNSDIALATWLSINTVFSVISFHMMGYVAMQYHEELGEPEPETIKTTQEKSPPYMAGSALLEQFILDGNVPAATEELRSLIHQDPDNLALRKRLHQYALITQQTKVLKRNCKEFIALALKQRNIGLAAQVFNDSTEHELPCHPDYPKDYLPLLKELRSLRRFKTAITLAKGFHKRFPENPETVPVYLELAQLFSEDMQRDELSMQLLDYSIKSFPDHPLRHEITAYREVIKNL